LWDKRYTYDTFKK